VFEASVGDRGALKQEAFELGQPFDGF
jgi:hypothetical protein